jgi:PhzF family phenazine biosynthesis protein
MTTAYRYKKIDAFTAGGSSGNPAACLYLAPGQRLDDEQMLSIARQHKGFVSEVVYCAYDADGAIHLTYYSSECEVDFCGHGTIACMVDLIRDTPTLLAQDEIVVHTHRKGPLTVHNRIAESDAVLITAPAPIGLGTDLRPAEVAAALGVGVDALDPARPLDVIDAGLRTLIVGVRDLGTEVSMLPDEASLRGFCLEQDVDIVLVFTTEVATPGHIAHTRVFAPRFGYLEDPATGSGNSAFGAYMLANGLWDGGECAVEQGGSDRVFNDVHLAHQDGVVLFGGSATVRIDGSYLV